MVAVVSPLHFGSGLRVVQGAADAQPSAIQPDENRVTLFFLAHAYVALLDPFQFGHLGSLGREARGQGGFFIVRAGIRGKRADGWRLKRTLQVAQPLVQHTLQATGGLESMLNQGLSNLQSALQAPTISPLPTYASSYNEKAALAARLAAEAAEVAELEGVKQCYVGVCKKEKGNTVFVWLDGRRLSICCPLDYPQTAPKVQWADNGHHKVPLNWSEGMSLSHIVADIRATAQA